MDWLSTSWKLILRAKVLLHFGHYDLALQVATSILKCTSGYVKHVLFMIYDVDVHSTYVSLAAAKDSQSVQLFLRTLGMNCFNSKVQFICQLLPGVVIGPDLAPWAAIRSLSCEFADPSRCPTIGRSKARSTTSSTSL